MNLIDMLDGIDVFIGCKLVEEKIANFVQSSVSWTFQDKIAT